MIVKLIIVWILAVIAFFLLWALLAKLIKRISERKHGDDSPSEDADSHQ